MIYNTMGNFIELTGKNAEKVMSKILIPVPDSEDEKEKMLDLSKIIPVNNQDNEKECFEKWGTTRNADNTQHYYKGEGNPPREADVIYFDTHDPVPKVIAELAKQWTDLHIYYEYCDADATEAGMRVYMNGTETESSIYPYRQKGMMSAFFNLWGREDEFIWNREKKLYCKIEEMEAE